MKVFISQPMSGLTDAEIIAVREKIFGDYEADHPGATLMDAYSEIKKHMGEFYTFEHPNVAMLGEAVQALADSDVILFAPGWENHRGCRIEQKIATYYDIPMEYVR